MSEIPSAQYMETYEFVKWATENWKLLFHLYKSQYKPQEPDETFLDNSIQLIKAFQKENHHLCILVFLMENMSLLSDVLFTSFFEIIERVFWDEEEMIRFEKSILYDLHEQLEEMKKSQKSEMEQVSEAEQSEQQ